MNHSSKIIISVFIAIYTCFSIRSQVHDQSWRSIVNQNEGSWFASVEAREIAENVLLYQRNIGGWPKNIQMQKPLDTEDKQALVELKSDGKNVTTDNGATFQEMLFLSKMYRQVPDERYKRAFLAGLEYLLEAQYDNGGWPQYYPLRKGYYSHITYNDDSMVNILEVLKELIDNTDYFSIKPPKETLGRAKLAFDKGIDCILKTQYRQNDVLTSWCAQYDEKTMLPAKARAYELPSLSGKESAKIVLLLMSIEKPSKEVVTSVNSAVAWFEKVKITGLREEKSYNEKGKIIDKKMVPDPEAPPLWARFMELEDNTPFFCDRDGIKKASLSEIGEERRNGYAWYTNEPKEVLKKYPKWEKKYLVSTGSKELRNQYHMVVAKDGTGDFTTIQDAIYSSKSFPYQRVIIEVKNGVYYEKVHIPEWNTKISLIGESKENTIITYDDYFDKIDNGRNSTFQTYTLLVEGDDFFASDLTVENSSGEVGQAVALSLVANRVLMLNCNFLGNQDTLYMSGEGNVQYFKDCYIEGTTDFIFGEATVLFENCIIHSKKDSYITAASTPQGVDFGFVFMNCKLTADENVNRVYLGRPWRVHAKTVFVNCELGGHISPDGWDNWGKSEAEITAFYGEYNCYGEGFKPENRVAWAHQLTKSQLNKYKINNILNTKNCISHGAWYSKL